MKTRLLMAASLLACASFAVRCGSTSHDAPDAAAPIPEDAAVVIPSDAAFQAPDTGRLPCDPALCKPGNICVRDRCMLACARHTECPDGYDCKNFDGKLVCDPNGQPYADGKFGYGCGLAGAVCADGFRCVGGKLDPNSYCTRSPCKDDTECPGSYYCTDTEVAPATDGGTPDTGKGYDAGFQPSPSVTVRTCLKRGFCAPATGAVDCHEGDAVFEKDSEGRGWCLSSCSGTDPNRCGSSSNGNVCVAGGDAGVNTCWPRAMTCAASHKFCGRCTSRSDCPAGSLCYVEQFSKERMCLSACGKDSDCNKDANLPPDRLPGACDTEYGLCLPKTTGYSASPNGMSCWFPQCVAPVAGCAAKDYVDATAAGANRTIVADMNGALYRPACLKIAKGQSVTFQGDFDPNSATGCPLTETCGPTYAFESVESGTETVVKFGVAGTYGVFCPLYVTSDQQLIEASVMVVP